VARQRSIDDLSVDELRQLLMEKRRTERQTRLDAFRKTGRVIRVEPQPVPVPLEGLRTGSEEPGDEEAPRRGRKRTWADQLLLVVEIGAIAGLIFILFNGFRLLQSLNQEVSAVLVQPTLTPTPIIMAVVLPSGHTPPDSPGGVQPNEAEIPEHLRPLIQSIANLPVPTPGPEQAIRIQIPAINIDAPVVQGDGWEQLKKGVGQHVGSPNPGQKGNIVLSAHNDVFGQLFRDLDRLKDGDQIILFTNARAYVYVIRQSQIVEPTQVEVMAPSQEPVVTLISCYPYMVDKQRIVVSAILEEQR
jgi:sortase A